MNRGDPRATPGCLGGDGLRVPGAIRAEMIAHAQRERPRECCGLLGGREGQARSIFPLRNEAASATEYLVSEGLFAPFRALRARGEDLMAIYHSHPASPAVPSRLDIEKNLYPDVVHIVISLAGPEPDVRGYRLAADRYREVPLACVVDPSGVDP